MTRITISQAAKRGFGFNPTLYRAITGRVTPSASGGEIGLWRVLSGPGSRSLSRLGAVLD